MTEDKDRKYCPFTLGLTIPSWCIEHKCMAWRGTKLTSMSGGSVTIIEDGYCKLIDHD